MCQNGFVFFIGWQQMLDLSILTVGWFEVKDLLLGTSAHMEKTVKHGDMAVLHLKIAFP